MDPRGHSQLPNSRHVNGNNSTIVHNGIKRFYRVLTRWMKHPNGSIFLIRQRDERN
jgi:hypothetical protein